MLLTKMLQSTGLAKEEAVCLAQPGWMSDRAPQRDLGCVPSSELALGCPQPLTDLAGLLEGESDPGPLGQGRVWGEGKQSWHKST